MNRFSRLIPHVADTYATLVIKLRFVLLAIIITFTAIATSQIINIDMRNDPDTLLPNTHRHVIANQFVEHNFGMGNIMVIGLENLQGDIYQPWFVNKVVDIHHQLEDLISARPYNFISIAAKKVRYIHGTDDGLDIHQLLPRNGIDLSDPAASQQAIDELRTGIEKNPLLSELLISQDSRSTFIIADFDESVKQNYLKFYSQVKQLVAEQDDQRINIYVAGEPYFLAAMLQELKDHWYLFVISIALVAIILVLESWCLRAAILPLIGVSISVIWTLGLMGITGYKLTTMMILTPVLVFAIGIGHSIQVLRRYREELTDEPNSLIAAHRAISQTIIPASMAILTDVIGFLVLLSEEISFYRAYAIFGQFGMLSLLLTCTSLLPILAHMINLPAPTSKTRVKRWEIKFGDQLTTLIAGPGKWLPITMIALLLGISSYFIPDIERGINYAEAAFKPDSTVIRDLHALNEKMPGIITFNIPIVGKHPDAMQDVNLLRGLNQMEQALREDPAIGYTTSLAQYIQLLNYKMFNDSDEMWVIPYDQQLINQYLFTYSLGGDPGDLSTVTDYDYTNGQLFGFINTLEPAELERVMRKITSYIELYSDNRYFEAADISISDPISGLPGIGGFAGTSDATREVSEQEWIRLPLTTALLVGILIAIMFRSLAMAGLIMLMVMITLISQYGLAGYFSSMQNWGGNLHFGNLVALSIGVGLGVDYSIYLADRIKLEYRQTQDTLEAFRRSFHTTGSSALLSVFVLLFSLIPLMATSLANTWGLAIYIAVAILVSVGTAMTLLPILIRATINLPITLTESADLLNLQVTERTRELQRERDELNQTLELLQETQQQLIESEKMASLGSLVAGVAHEINTPLGNAVIGATHLREEIEIIEQSIKQKQLRQSQLDEFLDTANNSSRIIYNNLSRAAALIQSFKQVAADQSNVERRRIKLKSYTEEVLQSLHPKFKRTHIDIKLDCPEELSLMTDPGSYAQILSNLLINSLMHGFQEENTGVIQILISEQLSRHGQVIQIIYCDDGRGMDEDTRRHAFDPFFTTRRGQGGSGLGLHIVYNLVTQTLGGQIRLNTDVHKGVEFIITIPDSPSTTEGIEPR